MSLSSDVSKGAPQALLHEILSKLHSLRDSHLSSIKQGHSTYPSGYHEGQISM